MVAVADLLRWLGVVVTASVVVVVKFDVAVTVATDKLVLLFRVPIDGFADSPITP